MAAPSRRAYHLIQLVEHLLAELESIETTERDLKILCKHYHHEATTAGIDADHATYSAVLALVKTFP